jgi:hypothetical protein
LNEGLQLVQKKRGKDRFSQLVDMSDRMRAHLETDPKDKTEYGLKGRAIIEEMMTLLRQRARKF